MGILQTIGQGVATFCRTVWNGLKAVWGLIVKVVTKLCSWAVSILGWLGKVATEFATLLAIGVVVLFIWIFGDDDDLDDETPDEGDLGKQIGGKLGQPHKKIIVKGVFNKNTQQIEKKTEIEATDKISSDIKAQTGGNRFAEIECED